MKILFIGNSYTYYNELPKLFLELSVCNGKNVSVDSVTKGGRKLYENLAEGDEKKLIIDSLLEKNKYDILFLQEQSYLPLVNCEAFEKGVSGLIKLVGAKRNILYATWGRKSGSDLLEKHGWTSHGMTDSLDSAYKNTAKINQADVSHVGMCFKAITKDTSTVELYAPDLSHPSYTGSCVAAIAHYKTVFGEMPEDYSAISTDEITLNTIIKAVEHNA